MRGVYIAVNRCAVASRRSVVSARVYIAMVCVNGLRVLERIDYCLWSLYIYCYVVAAYRNALSRYVVMNDPVRSIANLCLICCCKPAVYIGCVVIVCVRAVSCRCAWRQLVYRAMCACRLLSGGDDRVRCACARVMTARKPELQWCYDGGPGRVPDYQCDRTGDCDMRITFVAVWQWYR